jgi:hypothetical protein
MAQPTRMRLPPSDFDAARPASPRAVAGFSGDRMYAILAYGNLNCCSPGDIISLSHCLTGLFFSRLVGTE